MIVDEFKIAEYFKLSNQIARMHPSRRKEIKRARIAALWDSMNDEERQTVSKRWRDPS